LTTFNLSIFVRRKQSLVRLYPLIFVLTFFSGISAIGDLATTPERKPKKAAKEKIFIDPSLTTLEGTLSFDENTQKALERSKVPGVLRAEKEESNKIYRIEIAGAKKTEPDAVVLRLASKVDELFNPVLVSKDINEIMKMGLFSDVRVYYKVLSSGAVELRYELEEIPTIFQIKIVGNEALSQDTIKEGIAGLENYHVAKESRIKENAEKIRELYVSKGYFLAKVTYEIKSTSLKDIRNREITSLNENKSMLEIDTKSVNAPDFVDVIFYIQENSKVLINRISFLGNRYIDDDVFRMSIRSRENHLLSVMTDWGTFRQDFLEMDNLIIEKILHDHGFLHAIVFSPDMELSADQSKINIIFRMEENKQYRLGDVTIEGDLIENSEVIYRLHKKSYPNEPIFLASDLLSSIKQQEGDAFNKSLMAENVLNIAESYQNIGYAYVNVSPIPTLNEENNVVDINIKVESGPKVTIERIDIEGNERTKDEVIRRKLLIFEGDIYSSSLIKFSQQNVQQLGYFENIELTTRPGSASDKMILNLKVKEKSTGNIQFGAGYASGGEGLNLRGQISNENLFGRGQTLSASINWSSSRQMFDVSFYEPYLIYLFDNPLAFAFTTYNRDLALGEFNRRATGGDVTIGYPLGAPLAEISRAWKKNVRSSLMHYVLDFEALSFLLTYTAERVKISDLTMPVRMWDLQADVPRYTTSLRPTIRLDQRDNRIYPTRGFFFELRSEFASAYLGGLGLAKVENNIRSQNKNFDLSNGRDYMTPEAQANNFIRFGTNFRFYHNLDDWFFLKGLVFKSNLELGVLNTLGTPLIFENYAIGGSNTVRGYHYRSLSPVQRASPLYAFDPRQDMHVGGNKQFHGSFELEFPIFKALKLSGVLFFDFGNVFSPDENFFYIGGKSVEAQRIKPSDPLKIYKLLGLYSSAGFGIRWQSPFLGLLRFEWGFPLNIRPAGTPGLSKKDPPMQFEFNIGPSF
jgi:outer membrane protein insertion porin family